MTICIIIKYHKASNRTLYFLRGGGGMRAYKTLLILFFIIVSGLYSKIINCKPENKNYQLRLALFDTVGKERWVYRPFIKLAQSAGFSVTYLSVDKIMDFTCNQLQLPSYDGALFIVGSEFFGGFEKSEVCKKVFDIIASYSSLKNRLLGLILPAAHVENPQKTNVIGAYSPFFKAMGLPIASSSQGKTLVPWTVFGNQRAPKTDSGNTQSFLNTANLFLTTPVERRSIAYDTTLNPPHHGFIWDCESMQKRLIQENSNVYLLPIRNTCSQEIKNTLPYGIYWKNPLSTNHFVLLSPTVLSCAGISESFHFCPINSALKKEILIMLQRTLCELKMLMTKKSASYSATAQLLKNQIIPVPFPKALQNFGKPLKSHMRHSAKTAWMELAAFYEDDMPADWSKEQREKALHNKNRQQDDLIHYIFQAQLDALWISITPNIYYSPIAKMTKKDDAAATQLLEKKFLNSLSLFTTKLKQASSALSAPIPKIIIGFEIANNLYGQNTPKNFALDLFGNNYQDLPAPLEQSFWEQEIKIPLEVFLKKWQDQRVSNGVPISGVMLDLEMYCRKKTGTFLTTMGFDEKTFDKFYSEQHSVPVKPVVIHDRVRYLMQYHLTKKYFQFLEQQAQSLGSSLKDFFLKKIPDCQIMCYTPNILSNWFYKGFCKGLTRGEQSPLHLLTFNSEFKVHQKWFKKNGIPVNHAQVLLLSKLKKSDDYKMVQEILQTHHGVWYNRFSRLVERYDAQSWTSVEQSSMDEKQTKQFFVNVRSLQ